MSVAFRVYGIPVTQGSMRSPKAGVVIHDKAKALRAWRNNISMCAVNAMSGYDEPMQGAVRVELNIWIPRPDGCTDPYPINKGDIDKHERACLDAMSKTVYVDDGQVCDVVKYKRYADDEKPGVEIRVTPL